MTKIITELKAYDTYKYRTPDYPCYRYPNTVTELVAAIVDVCKKEFQGKTIGLICRGSSGLYLATMCSMQIENSSVIYVRKEHESSHGNFVENFYDDRDVYIIVDDFVASGKTINEIISRLKSECPDNFEGKYIGIAAGYVKNKIYNFKEKDETNFFKFYIS